MIPNIFKKKNEPWVKIIEAVDDPMHGYKFKLDWNDAFITELRNNGYTGDIDEQIIECWLRDLCNDNRSKE